MTESAESLEIQLAEAKRQIRFLRERRGVMETARQSGRHTAADRSRALDVLRGVVVIAAHPFNADPYSDAGNCWCGRHDGHELHRVVIEP